MSRRDGPTLILLLPGPHLPEFLLPFRKPKRIRTAFSPSQLLKLEQAFEKNQYVVGQERKELAKSLNLSETQVRTVSPALLSLVSCLQNQFPEFHGEVLCSHEDGYDHNYRYLAFV